MTGRHRARRRPPEAPGALFPWVSETIEEVLVVSFFVLMAVLGIAAIVSRLTA